MDRPGGFRRRLAYLPQTAQARAVRRGPTPADDVGWADLLRGWVECTTEVLVADVEADLAGRAAPSPDVVGRARRLWNLAHLHRNGLGGPRVGDALPAARRCLDRHLDPEHGGWVWSIGPQGDVVDGQKLLYGQTVAVYALCELARTGSEHAAGAVVEAEAGLARPAEHTTSDGVLRQHLDRQWKPLPLGTDTEMGLSGTVSLGTQLHLVEAATALHEVSDSASSRAVARAAVELIHGRFLPAEGPPVAWTDENGDPLDAVRSLGHEVEAAWIVADAAAVTGIAGEREWARSVVERAIAEGFRRGGLDDAPFPGWRPLGQRRSWWVQAELLRALVEIDDGPRSPTRAPLYELLAWLHRHQVDPRTGQAWQLVTHRGVVVVTGATNSTRTGYHDLRAYVATADLLAR